MELRDDAGDGPGDGAGYAVGYNWAVECYEVSVTSVVD